MTICHCSFAARISLINQLEKRVSKVGNALACVLNKTVPASSKDSLLPSKSVVGEEWSWIQVGI